MTSRGKDTSSVHGEIERHIEDTCLVLVHSLDRDEPDHGALGVKNLRVTLSERLLTCVPLAAFHVHALDIDTVLRSSGTLISDNLVVQVHSVDGNLELSGIVLTSSGQETVCEEELVDPEDSRDAIVKPVAEELNTALHILDVAAQRFERVETLTLPKIRDLIQCH